MADSEYPPERIPAVKLHWLLETLLTHHGRLNWWPAQSTFEILVGAVLTQNTAWSNVERAITKLRAEGLLNPQAILNAAPDQLSSALRPSGYFNVKAQRLRNLCSAYLACGGWNGMAELETTELRRQLLEINGVGRETADDILLYAFDRPVFVIDAYTRRIFTRLGWIAGTEGYETLREAVEKPLCAATATFNELHAQLVILGKDLCRPRPRCPSCPLNAVCAYPGHPGHSGSPGS